MEGQLRLEVSPNVTKFQPMERFYVTIGDMLQYLNFFDILNRTSLQYKIELADVVEVEFTGGKSIRDMVLTVTRKTKAISRTIKPLKVILRADSLKDKRMWFTAIETAVEAAKQFVLNRTAARKPPPPIHIDQVVKPKGSDKLSADLDFLISTLTEVKEVSAEPKEVGAQEPEHAYNAFATSSSIHPQRTLPSRPLLSTPVEQQSAEEVLWRYAKCQPDLGFAYGYQKCYVVN